MRILITNLTLAGRTGTECVVRDLACGLLRAGHQPEVYSPELGPIAGEIVSYGIPVVSSLDRIAEPPDIIHGHHHIQTLQALDRFPTVPGIFVCHDRFAWHDVPPPDPRIRRTVAVDLNCLERYSDPSQVRIIFNWADTRRFRQRPRLPSRPLRALIFSNYAGPGTHLEPVREACSHLGISLDIAGLSAHTQTDQPENLLPNYDLVFAKARCAIEAMACGSAVILCDAAGLGPLVTPANVAELRPWNFGMRCLTDPLEPSAIVSEIENYNVRRATQVTAYIRKHATLDAAVKQYLTLYCEALSEPFTPATQPLEALLQRQASLERRLFELQQYGRMQPLAEDNIAGIWLAALETPAQVPRATSFAARVRITNRSEATLKSAPPFPIHLSYQWASTKIGRLIVAEGTRSALTRPVAPAQAVEQYMRIDAPSKSGTYELRLCLVQENWQWLNRRAQMAPRVLVTIV